jgi:hypothetical protein
LIVDIQDYHPGGGPKGLAAIVLAMLCVGSLAGCTSSSQPRLAREANRLAERGAKVADTEVLLARAGFRCGPSGGKVICTRLRSDYVIATCVQRISLTLDTGGSRVETVETPPIACAGF